MSREEREKPQVKITPEEFRYMTLLHELTGVHVLDCVIDDENNRIIFLVKPSEIGKAIGPKGIFVQTLKKMLNKNIEIVGYSDNIEELTKYALAPARVKEVKIAERPGGKKIVYATVEPGDKAIAIGKNGKNVARARLLLNRYFNIDTVIIA
ncbi:NusA-like transcription termination signal-binding factor [Thermogladius sp. 4427co]|uniref:NusA-like transcription termination signal-binding factor n=1 Tax=Thermogladius sp. 4427co TaxID=3450718 RepID=UPI003F7AF290